MVRDTSARTSTGRSCAAAGARLRSDPTPTSCSAGSPKPGLTGPALARRLYVDHGILIKDCAAEDDARRPIATCASRRARPAENRRLVDALSADRAGPSAERPQVDRCTRLRDGGLRASCPTSPTPRTCSRSLGWQPASWRSRWPCGASIAGAAISLVGAFVFDVIDGPVAKRTPGRTDEQGAFGANLDSLADMVSAGAALGVVILSYGHFRARVRAGGRAARCGHRAATELLQRPWPRRRLRYLHRPADRPGHHQLRRADAARRAARCPPPSGSSSASAGSALAALMVSPLRIPKLTGRAYLALFAVAVLLALAHTIRLIV